MLVGDIWDVTPALYGENQVALHVLAYRVVSLTGAGVTANEVAAAGDTKFSAAITALCSSEANYVGTLAQHIWPAPTGLLGKGVANAGVGGGGTPCCPRQVAGLISKNSNTPGRSGRGHTYVGFVPVEAVQGMGAPTGAYLALLSTLATAMMEDMAVTGGTGTALLRPGIYSRKSHTIADYTLVGRETQFATQRRRGAYGRTNPNPV